MIVCTKATLTYFVLCMFVYGFDILHCIICISTCLSMCYPNIYIYFPLMYILTCFLVKYFTRHAIDHCSSTHNSCNIYCAIMYSLSITIYVLPIYSYVLTIYSQRMCVIVINATSVIIKIFYYTSLSLLYPPPQYPHTSTTSPP